MYAFYKDGQDYTSEKMFSTTFGRNRRVFFLYMTMCFMNFWCIVQNTLDSSHYRGFPAIEGILRCTLKTKQFYKVVLKLRHK